MTTNTSVLNIPLKLVSNNSGGTLGGITTGEDVYFNIAIKSVSTISKPQVTCDYLGKESLLEAKGRHDPCVLPRAMPIVESMAALVVMDFVLIQFARNKSLEGMVNDVGYLNELEEI